MAVRDYCRCDVRTVKGKLTLREAAQRMADEGVGCLVIVRGERALGVITDRDIAMHVLREGLDPDTTLLTSLIDSEPPATVHANTRFDLASLIMRRRGVRRLVVVEDADVISGVITLDDMVQVIARELSDVAGVLAAQSPSNPAAQLVVEAGPEGA
jgi:CBS domain-containing protein